MKIKPISVEQTLGASNSTVSDASLVRIFNDSGVDVLITTPGGTVTIANNTVEYLAKLGSDEISSSSDVKAVSVAYF